jgi:uncharacterized protein (DUF4213/DUF364 family)
MDSPIPSANQIVEAILSAVAEAPAAGLTDLAVGSFWTVVHTSVGAGMASSMRSEIHLHGRQPITDAGALDTRTPVELAELLRSESPPEAAIGLAAANALLGSSARGLTEEKAVTILKRRGAGKQVAMIGHFPFADRLREDCEQLWVFERGLNRHDGDLDHDSMDRLLPEADVVAITATTLLNRTLPSVLARVGSDAFVMLLGPSTPMTPAMHALGIDVLCGTLIDDPARVYRAVTQGAVTSQITGIRRMSLWKDDPV